MKTPWPEVKLEKVLTEVSRPENIKPELEYRLLGMRWYAGGLFEKERKKGQDIRAAKIYRVEKGDLIYNRLFAWKGSFGIAGAIDAGAYVSNEFPCFAIDEGQVLPEYLRWYMSRLPFWRDVETLSTGSSRQSRLRLKQARFLGISIHIPSLPEQKYIVDKIEQIATRVRETRRLVAEIETEQEYFLQSAYKDALKNSIKMPLSKCLYPYCQTVNIQDDIKYMQLTVSMHFRGISLRQILLGAKIKTKLQYRADEGDFIYSRIDARNGAFGFVPKELDGAIVTGDFPCFKVDENIINRDVLAIIIRKPEFTQSVIDASRGVTNRKRLKEEQLLSIIVDVPEKSYQKILSFLSHRVKKAQELHRQIALDLEYMMPALLNQAFRGGL